MRIVFLTPKFYPEIGGVEKHAFEIAKILSKQNEVTVITEGIKDGRENIKGIKVVRFSFEKNGWFKKFIIWRKVIKNRKIFEKADIIHCHDVFFWYLPLRLMYPWKKVFITFHGYETVYPPTLKAIFIRKLSEKLSNGNIAIGAYIKKWYGTKSDFVLYGAVDQIHSKFLKHKFGKRLNVLFIGRVGEDMGVRVYSEILKKLKNYRFEVCGDGNLRNEFKRYGKVNGFVQNLDKYIRKADIVFSSSYLSIIFAMRYRKPVFAVFENSLKEDYLKMTPFGKWIYISKSPKDLFKKIRTVTKNNNLKNNKLREKNINLAYNWASKQTWKSIAEKYIELWV